MRKRAVLLAGVGAMGVVAAASATALPAAAAGEVGQPRHLVLMIVYASVALVFSFLCSVAEAVVLSVSPSFVAHLQQQGKPLATRLEGIRSNIDRSLAGILTLNTIAHTVGAGGAGAEAAAYFGERWVGVSMAVLTLLILFLSEIVPKTLGAVYWRRLAGPMAAFVRFLLIVLAPLIWVSERLTGLITRGKPTHTFSREEFAALAEVGVAGGYLEMKESRIVKNLFRFREVQVSDIMTPRTVVFALQQDLTIADALEHHPDLPFSRIPIYGENRDDARAFILKVDMMREQLAGRGERSLRQLGREIHGIAADASLAVAFDRLLDDQQHLMLVFDEYGGMAGLVSLEDVVETLVGEEIVDEVDETEDLRKLARQRWDERRRNARTE